MTTSILILADAFSTNENFKPELLYLLTAVVDFVMTTAIFASKHK